MRAVMALTVEYDVGRALLGSDQKQAELHLRNFQAGVPEDTNGYCESFADLGEALMGQLSGPNRTDRRDKTRAMSLLLSKLTPLVSEGQRALGLRLPVLRRLEPADFPKMEQLRNHVRTLDMAVRQASTESGRAGPSPSSPVPPRGATDGSRQGGQKCFACGALTPAMLKCAACKVATCCSKECQKSHWKAHKATCKRLARG